MNERDLFETALEMATAEERSDFLRDACGGDTELRERVEGLLRTHERTGDFLQLPLADRLAAGVAALEDADGTAPDSAASRERGDDLGFLSPSDQPGSLGRLGHYEVREVIGRGGMGIVLRAFDERLHRVVAIKTFAPSLAANATSRKRFLREARAAAAVCHDHIVTIHAVEESGDLPYLVMQCISGPSLQQRIDRDGPLALHEILRIGMQTAAGMAAAHAQGLIHRDIKPANILLENGVERVKITDFGLARATADASVTQTGMVAGTPHYMAPEQARGEALDCRTDLFSLGSVLYAMCTGRAPFRAGNSMAVLKHVCDDVPRPIREANADIPDWLIAVVEKLHAKNPNDRYQSAAEVAELLGQRLARLQHPSMPAPTARLPVAAEAGRKPVRRRLAWAAGVAAAAALLLLGVSFTEASGVTQFVPTVIRIVRGEGTLVVEVADPTVQVSLDGEELSIRGAGLQELRLTPGDYRLQATKDGKQIKNQLVTVTRDGRRVVTVTLESSGGEGSGIAARAVGRPVAELELLAKLDGHTDVVRTVAFLPDSEHLMSVGRDEVVRTWNVETGSVLFPIPVDGTITDADIAVDGRLVAVASTSRVNVWDFEKRLRICDFSHDGTRTNCIRLSPDGKHVVTSGYPSAGVLWEIETANQLRRFDVGEESDTWAVEFSPNGQLLALGAIGRVRLFDVASGIVLGDVRLRHSREVLSIAFASGSNSLACGQMGGHFSVVDVERRQVTASVAGSDQDDHVTGVRFVSDQLLLIAYKEGTVRLWDLKEAKVTASAVTDWATNLRLAVTGDGRYAATGGGEAWDKTRTRKLTSDYALRLWQLPESVWPKQPPLTSSADATSPQSTAQVAIERPVDELELLAKLEGHTGIVRGVAFSPDGRRMVSAGSDNFVRVWDSESRSPLSTFQVEGNVRAADISSDGRFVALATAIDGPNSGMFEVWDLASQKRICKVPPKNVTYLTCIRFSPDGTRVVTSGNPSDGVLWDVATGMEIRRFVLDEPGPSLVAEFSPDGRLVALGAVGRVRLFDVESGDVIGDVRLPSSRTVLAMAFDSESGFLACGQVGGDLNVIDVRRNEATEYFATEDPSNVFSVRFLADSQYLCTSIAGGKLRIWDRKEKRIVAAAMTELGTNRHIDVSPDGVYAVTACGEGRDASNSPKPTGDYALRLWQLPEIVWPKQPAVSPSAKKGAALPSVLPAVERPVDELTLLAKLDEHANVVLSVAFSPDGSRMVSAGWDGTVCVWSTENRSPLSQVRAVTGDAIVSSDGRLVAGSDNAEGVMRVWDVEQEKVVCRFAQEFPVGDNCLRFTPDGSGLLISGQRLPYGALWDAATGTELGRFDIGKDEGVHRAAFSPDGRLLAIGASGRVRLFDVESKAIIADVPLLHPWNIWDLAFARSGKTLAAGQGGGYVSLIDVGSRKVIKTLQASAAKVRSLRFLGDERFLLTSSYDATLRLWDVETKTVLAQAATENGSQLIFVSPDGRQAITAGGKEWNDAAGSLKDYGDYAMRLWQLPESVWPAEPLSPGAASQAGPD